MTTTSAIPLSNDDEEVIHRTVPAVATSWRVPRQDIDEVYEVDDTAHKIKEGGFKRIALQFPDELLIDSTEVATKLQVACGSEVHLYVLGDTSYGSCCVDEVAAEHVDADCLVHYGRSCLSAASRLPIIYVFGRLPMNIDALLEQVSDKISIAETPVLVVSDTTYMSSQSAVVKQLGSRGYNTIIESKLSTSVDLDGVSAAEWQRTLPGRLYCLPPGTSLSDVVMLYVGPPSPTLTTTLMTHSSLVSKIYSYNPITNRLMEETTQNVALRRRYATVQKARDAGVVGIVVGTLGVSRYLELISHLRRMISNAGKKSYLFAMGKLNPSKMANFAEIDAFVLVACGENSLVESRDFYKPVVTPFELSLALNTKPHDSVPWNGDWITDFERVISMPSQQTTTTDSEEEDRDADAPHFSLVTGKYASSSKPMYRALETATDADSAVTTRSTETSLSLVGGLYSPAAQHLKQRQHWAGLGTDHAALEQAADEVGASSVAMTEGRTGVARGYDDHRHGA